MQDVRNDAIAYFAQSEGWSVADLSTWFKLSKEATRRILKRYQINGWKAHVPEAA